MAEECLDRRVLPAARYQLRKTGVCISLACWDAIAQLEILFWHKEQQASKHHAHKVIHTTVLCSKHICIATRNVYSHKVVNTTVLVKYLYLRRSRVNGQRVDVPLYQNMSVFIALPALGVDFFHMARHSH